MTVAVTHSVLGSAVPAAGLLQEYATIKTGTSFYVTSATLVACVGGRIYIPPAMVATLPATVRLSVFATTLGLNLSATPAATVIVAIPPEGGWVEATWGTPVAISPNVPFLVSAELVGTFVAGYLTDQAIQALDGAPLFMQASAQRAWYQVGGGSTLVNTGPGRWYGTDAIVAEAEVIVDPPPDPDPEPEPEPTPSSYGGLALTTEDLAYMRETQAETRPTAAELSQRIQGTSPSGGRTDTWSDPAPIQVRLDANETNVPAQVTAVLGNVPAVKIVTDLVDIRSGDTITVSPTEVYQVVSDGDPDRWASAQVVWAKRVKWGPR